MQRRELFMNHVYGYAIDWVQDCPIVLLARGTAGRLEL